VTKKPAQKARQAKRQPRGGARAARRGKKARGDADAAPAHAGEASAGRAGRNSHNGREGAQAPQASNTGRDTPAKTADVLTTKGKWNLHDLAGLPVDGVNLMRMSVEAWVSFTEAERRNLRQLVLYAWRYDRQRKGKMPAALNVLNRGNRTMHRGHLSIDEQCSLRKEADNFVRAAKLANQLREALDECSGWRDASSLSIPVSEYVYFCGLEDTDLRLESDVLPALAANLQKAAVLFSDLACTEEGRKRGRPQEDADRNLLAWAERIDLDAWGLARLIADQFREAGSSVAAERTKWARHFHDLKHTQQRQRTAKVPAAAK
jgi:hypothetical protein